MPDRVWMFGSGCEMCASISSRIGLSLTDAIVRLGVAPTPVWARTPQIHSALQNIHALITPPGLDPRVDRTAPHLTPHLQGGRAGKCKPQGPNLDSDAAHMSHMPHSRL